MPGMTERSVPGMTGKVDAGHDERKAVMMASSGNVPWFPDRRRKKNNPSGKTCEFPDER